MKRIELANMVSIGKESIVNAIHLAAAKAVMTRNPHVVFDASGSNERAIEIVICEFKEEFYFLDYKKLSMLVKTLSGIKQKMFTSNSIEGPLSVLGTCDSLESVLDMASAEMQIFKDSYSVFYDYTTETIADEPKV